MLKYALALMMSATLTPATAQETPQAAEQSLGPVLWKNIRVGQNINEVKLMFDDMSSTGYMSGYRIAPDFVVDVTLDLETRRHPDKTKTKHVKSINLHTIDDPASVIAGLITKYGEPRRKETKTYEAHSMFTFGPNGVRSMTIYEWYRDGVLITAIDGDPAFDLTFKPVDESAIADNL
jgi:hypothetical protein